MKKTFSKYAIETAKLLVKEYPWYTKNMPASVHKILLHESSCNFGCFTSYWLNV